jgi:nicotinamidase-related amidase
MKRFFILIATILILISSTSAQPDKRALLIIDIQDFYFPGGKSALVEPEKAAANAALLLEKFRKDKMPVIHVRHNAESGAEINSIVKPIPGEKIISKDEVNCFLNTDLLDYLKANHIKNLVICGMQTHMCVEAATRAASDLGFNCLLINDACATKNVTFGDKTVKAEDVHNSTLATLKNYAQIKSTQEYIKMK